MSTLVTICGSLRYTLMCDIDIRLQVDVIAASYAKLQRGIADARDYAEARRAHEAFVDTMVTQSFLDLPHFSKLLMVLFALVRRLCALLQVHDSRSLASLHSLPGSHSPLRSAHSAVVRHILAGRPAKGVR